MIKQNLKKLKKFSWRQKSRVIITYTCFFLYSFLYFITLRLIAENVLLLN